MNRAVVIFAVCLFVAVLSAETNSTFASAPAWSSRLTPDKAVSAATYHGLLMIVEKIALSTWPASSLLMKPMDGRLLMFGLNVSWMMWRDGN